MAFPTIRINNVTGSDTLASGAGPTVAITGTAAAHTNGSASTTITLTNSPNLSGVATDGSAALWLKTSSGRQFSKITAVDNTAKTVTVEDSFNIALASAVNYAIGGKRATLDNADTKTVFGGAGGVGAKGGWIIDVEETGTNYVLTSTLQPSCSGDVTNGPCILKSSSATRPLITCATNSVNIFTFQATLTFFTIENLRFSHTAGTRGAWSVHAGSIGEIKVKNCVVDGFTNGFNFNSGATSVATLEGCEAKNCTGSGFTFRGIGFMHGCYSHDNSGSGIELSTTGNTTVTAHRCIMARNAYGVRNTNATVAHAIQLFHCDLVDNTNDGIEVPNNTTAAALLLENNIFYGNGSFDIDSQDSQTETEVRIRGMHGNAFGGSLNGISSGSNAVTLTANPFTDKAAGDFSLNNTAGGGAACRAAGYPSTLGIATNYLDIGAMQHQDSGGSSGASRIIGSDILPAVLL